jgi:ATP-dependent Clp protease ATP-binding subunit ClpB
MTSNIGSQYILDADDPTEMRARVMEALRQNFRPEFLNRVDDVVIFDRLDKEQLREIAEILLSGVRKRLAERNISIALSDGAADVLINEGYDPVYGARPLKRVIQRRLIDPLAMKVLTGEVRDGDHVMVEAEGDDLVFTTVETAEYEEPVVA